ncbi:FHA domain-containing protein [Nonomuraea soli]|uniref:2-polyprenyl-6-methoxyphenol hydroxylase-like FAD-dependent oxidoreductase n=1 Tax=Nonomuraea soli TaxID=1032476 RepID=A0A7W0CV81_9ACTN|nr:FHA domain-containing protein [Nonomuraea soli]MBA2897870.1 2-polyprenyl-6-methoxyphenol hydroxylase-like FAD-dependent oxidoreductase [Nonomuraea soli]
MPSVIVGHDGPLAGRRFPLGDAPTVFGRRQDATVVITCGRASRSHAEVRREGERHVLRDLGSRNGTLVNGRRVTTHVLQPGDTITIGNERFRFVASDDAVTIAATSLLPPSARQHAADEPLRVTVAGGGPVGLSFALLLEHLMGPRVAVTVYDGRWIERGSRIVWKGAEHGNVRRQQVVTVQSRQYLNLPEAVQERLFAAGSYSEMWPPGPDSIRGHAPRNLRISFIEDTLLDLANDKAGRIRLVPARFSPDEHGEIARQDHVLAICDGGRSRTREHFAAKFGTADSSIYSLDGRHLQDVVLGLRVKSRLPDAMSVLLTVAQNRFLLNALDGEGFLNMRLTDEEAKEVIGIDPVRHVFEECVAASPCMMGRDGHGDFHCSTHGTLFLPALLKGSALWRRVREGLAMFGVAEDDLSAVTAFRLDMVQRPRFTARLHAPTASTPGTFGFLLGDAANAIHFWPGRGLNSGLASAISLARSLRQAWRGQSFRDADFIRHEAAMAMLQYRHKSRAWQAMVTTDEQGVTQAIKDKIATGLAEDDRTTGAAAIDVLMDRLRRIRGRLAQRVSGLPDDVRLRAHLGRLSAETLRSLAVSGAWDTLVMGGEEVDIDIFYGQEPEDRKGAEPVWAPRLAREREEHTRVVSRGTLRPLRQAQEVRPAGAVPRPRAAGRLSAPA